MKLDTHMIIFVMTIKKRYELDGVFVVCVDVWNRWARVFYLKKADYYIHKGVV